MSDKPLYELAWIAFIGTVALLCLAVFAFEAWHVFWNGSTIECRTASASRTRKSMRPIGQGSSTFLTPCGMPNNASRHYP